MMKKYKVVVNGETYEVGVEEITSVPSPIVHSSPAITTQDATSKEIAKSQLNVEQSKVHGYQGVGTVTAPMPGNINDIKVAVGDDVKTGDPLVVLEAMKMENEVVAPISGSILEINVKKGQTVQNKDVLVVIG